VWRRSFQPKVPFSYIVVGILNEILMYRAAGVNGIAAKLARIADYSTNVRLAIILKLGECFSVFVLAVALYGITRDEDRELAMLALLCRVAEGVFVATLIPNSQGCCGSQADTSESVPRMPPSRTRWARL
jgi:Domain of unknown function (DUF4386)